jgi:hypothetical protein
VIRTKGTTITHAPPRPTLKPIYLPLRPLFPARKHSK